MEILSCDPEARTGPTSDPLWKVKIEDAAAGADVLAPSKTAEDVNGRIPGVLSNAGIDTPALSNVPEDVKGMTSGALLAEEADMPAPCNAREYVTWVAPVTL